MSIKIKDLLSQPEISKYPSLNTEENLIKIFSKFCEFFTVNSDKTEIQYTIPDNITVFSILNIPQKLSKEEVKHHLELVNLQYNRLYKKGYYWFLSTMDKETVICVQNSLRELRFDETKVKYFHITKNQIMKNMREKIDKTAYQKDVKYLGYNMNNSNNKNKNYYYNKKHKNSDYSDSSNFSWRKNSGASKSSFDYGEKYTYKKNKYYKYKRNRFNSDNDRKFIVNNNENNNGEIEIDISKLKYDLNIKNKYTFQEIKNFYERMNIAELTRPKFLDEELTDILSDKTKTIVSLNELVEANDKIKKSENEKSKENAKDKNDKEKNEDKKNNETKDNKEANSNVNTNIKIPKMNPLSGMSKNFNKFDIVPGNAMPGMMMPFTSTTWIPESNNEN